MLNQIIRVVPNIRVRLNCGQNSYSVFSRTVAVGPNMNSGHICFYICQPLSSTATVLLSQVFMQLTNNYQKIEIG